MKLLAMVLTAVLMNVSVQAMADDFQMALRFMSKEIFGCCRRIQKAADKGKSDAQFNFRPDVSQR